MELIKYFYCINDKKVKEDEEDNEENDDDEETMDKSIKTILKLKYIQKRNKNIN